jgi:hypothetical protein
MAPLQRSAVVVDWALPRMLVLEMCSGAAPTLLTVTCAGALALSTAVLENARRVCLRWR